MPSSEARNAEAVQLQLARRFAAGMMSGPDFDSAFLAARGKKWAGETGIVATVLDQIFYGVDDYVADVRLRRPGTEDLDEEQLREIVRTQLRRLDEA